VTAWAGVYVNKIKTESLAKLKVTKTNEQHDKNMEIIHDTIPLDTKFEIFTTNFLKYIKT
jgi:hypothetical protein